MKSHMIVSEAHKQLVNQRVEQCIEKVLHELRYQPDLAAKIKKPTIRYDINSASLGGQAIGGHTVRLNPLFLKEYTDHYINQTVGHEMAHIFVSALYFGAQSHGREWKNMMRVLGIPANRTHNYKKPDGVQVGKPKMKYEYTCACCKEVVVVGPKYHAGLQKGKRYLHMPCGQRGLLVYQEPIGRMYYGDARKAAETKDYSATKQPAQPKQPRQGTKMDECRKMMVMYPKASRSQLIQLFMEQAKCTKAGAATYYNTLSK